MSKDPAFLFYPNDYIGGTMGMTFEEKGAYIELLMMQFNRGHMGGHMVGQAIGQLWDTVKVKFIQDSKGLWYNERLEQEQNKRKSFTDSRKNNLLGKNQHTDKGGHKTDHMEDENEDVNKSKNKDESEKSLHSVLKEIFLDYYSANKQMEYYWTAKDGMNLKQLITKLKHYTDEAKIPMTFQAMLKKNKDKWINDNLSISIINSKFNEIVSKIKGSTDPRLEEIERKFDVS